MCLALLPALIASQCYKQEEVILGRENFQKLALQTEISELSLKLAEDLLASQTENVECSELTCTAPYQTCLETLSLVRADKADDYLEHFQNFLPLDFSMSSDHCSFRTTGGQLRLEKRPVCMTYINTLGSTLNMEVNISSQTPDFNLIIENGVLTYLAMDKQLDKSATCQLTPSLLSLQLLDSELEIMLLKAKSSLDGLLSLLGKPTITDVISSCQESSSTLQKENLLQCVREKFQVFPSVTRSKRGTFLEYIFSNGAEVDTIANNLAGLGSLVNSNNQKIAKNEINLAIQEKALAQKIKYLDKTVSNNIKKEFGTVLGLQRLQNAFSAEIAYISANTKEITDILQLNEEIGKLVTIMIKVMQQDDIEQCLSLKGEFWCIDFKKSTVKLQETKI